MINTKMKILACLPFVILLVTLFLVSRIDLERFILTPGERQLLHFSPDKAEMESMLPLPAAATPVSFTKTSFFQTNGVRIETEFTGEDPLQNDGILAKGVAENNRNRPGLTLVVLNGGSRIAILNNHVVREGENVDGMTIKKIEKGKILVDDKTLLRWIYLEDGQ